ncbi:MAG: hypothetical protein SPK26_11860, partial [Treponema sp.]|nr:hypothetical protein [Treponema sp.]
ITFVQSNTRPSPAGCRFAPSRAFAFPSGFEISPPPSKGQYKLLFGISFYASGTLIILLQSKE